MMECLEKINIYDILNEIRWDFRHSHSSCRFHVPEPEERLKEIDASAKGYSSLVLPYVTYDG